MTRSLRLAPVLVLAARALGAQAPADTSWTTREEMIAMRDGVRLRTFVVSPRAQTAALPILLVRTPYGAGGPARDFPGPYHFAARPEDYRAQTHRIWRTARSPSHVVLSVLPP